MEFSKTKGGLNQPRARCTIKKQTIALDFTVTGPQCTVEHDVQRASFNFRAEKKEGRVECNKYHGFQANQLYPPGCALLSRDQFQLVDI